MSGHIKARVNCRPKGSLVVRFSQKGRGRFRKPGQQCGDLLSNDIRRGVRHGEGSRSPVHRGDP
jgi:hypothetical protein